jgi:solute carrier family 25 (mitochondrial folate transporter), member 32
MSGASKLFALAITYPYQVVRSRIQVRLLIIAGSFSHILFIQNNATTHLYPTIPATIKRTWVEEGPRGFYRGLGTNLVRVLPGTCVTFVVYENIAWLLRTGAARREKRLAALAAS